MSPAGPARHTAGRAFACEGAVLIPDTGRPASSAPAAAAPDLAREPGADVPAEPPAPLTGTAAVYVAGTIAAGALVGAVSLADVVSRPFAVEWGILLVLTAVSGWATLRVPAMPISFSISDTFSIVAALLFGPAAGALTAALDGLVLSFRMTRTRRIVHRVLFNIACPVISTWTAGQLFFALAGPTPITDGPLGALRLLVLLSGFGFVNFAVLTGMVAVAVAFERRQPVLAIWREHFSRLWITHLAGVFAAMLMMVLSRQHAGAAESAGISTLEVLILIAPLPVILYVTFRHALGRAADQITQLARMNKVYVGAIEALAQAIDAKDQVTHDHIRRVQHNAVRLAHSLAVDDDMEIQAIKAAALLHDVGKLGIPEHILNKPGRLSPPEFEIMKRHAPLGADILSMIGFPYPVVPIVRHHHESWDGSGYPDGLSGESIPIGARILAVVDCFDALTSDRPYRPALADRDALQILTERRGTMYDPRVVDAFFALHAADTGRAIDELTAGSEPPRIPAGPPQPAPAAHAPAAASLAAPDLDLFFALGQAMPRDASPAAAADAVWTLLRRHLRASAIVLFQYEEACDSLAPFYMAGDPAVTAGSRIRLGERLSGWVAASQQPMLNSDARLDVDPDLRESTALRTALSVPLLAGSQLRAVLTLYSRDTDAFAEHHLRVVHAAARLLLSRQSGARSAAA